MRANAEWHNLCSKTRLHCFSPGEPPNLVLNAEIQTARVQKGAERERPDRPLVPAEKVEEPNGAVCYLLKDGTEIHRIAPLPEVFEYVTGKPIGRAGPRRHSRPAFAPSTAEAEVVSAKKDDEVEILDL